MTIAAFCLGLISLTPLTAGAAFDNRAVTDPYGPVPEECQIAPLPLEDLQALAVAPEPKATPLVNTSTTDGTPELRLVELPDGPPADPAIVAAIRETARQMHACHNAFDLPRWFATFSDDELHSQPLLHRFATLAMNGEVPLGPSPLPQRDWTHFAGLFHARVLADGRIAAVAPVGNLGLLELYVFFLEEGTWRIDDIAFLKGEGDVADHTLTVASRFVDLDGPRSGYGYGFGLDLGTEWQALIDTEVGVSWGTALSNGTSIVVVGTPFNDPESGHPLTSVMDCGVSLVNVSANDFRHLNLRSGYFDQGAGLVPAQDGNGQPLAGSDDHRAYAIYEVRYRPGGKGSAAEPYRLYLECRGMDGGWVLGIAQLVPTTQYDAQITARDQLLATIEG
jgi:hypothetical protein